MCFLWKCSFSKTRKKQETFQLGKTKTKTKPQNKTKTPNNTKNPQTKQNCSEQLINVHFSAMKIRSVHGFWDGGELFLQIRRAVFIITDKLTD